MVKASKRLPSSVSVSKSALDNATLSLQGLPDKPKDNWSLREAVSVLQESISAALSKGYSYDEVAKMLSGKGVEISASSLKSYLSAAKRQQGTSAAKGKRTGQRTRKIAQDDADVNGIAAAVSGSRSAKSAGEPAAEQAAPRQTKVKAAAAKTAAKSKSAGKTSSSTVVKTAPRSVSRTRKTS
jgi:hypothetical protein